MGPKRLLGGCLACAALVPAACGGSPSPSKLSKSELAAKVNAACTTYATRSTAIPQPRDFASNPASAAAYLDKLRPLVESEHAAIARLDPPSELRARFDQFRAASSHQLRLFETALAKARAGDRSGLQDLLAAARYKRAVMVPLERTLGFGSCQR
jgi:hypothetical protein